MPEKKNPLVEALIAVVVHRSQLIEKLFILLVGLSVFWFLRVGTNYDMTKYLPASTATKQGIDIMKEEFGYPGTSSVMIKDVSFYEAKRIKEQIEAVPGVDSVSWADSAGIPYIGSDFLDAMDLDDHYKDRCALMDISFINGDADLETYAALDEIEKIVGPNADFKGTAYSNNHMRTVIAKEIPMCGVLAVIIIFVLLALTTTSWLEPVLFLITMGIGIVINMGTNLIFGEISFLSFSVSAVLQLAVSMDYSILFLHTFTDEVNKGLEAKEAMANTIRNSITAIASSALTTLIGFVALALMQFGIGKDMGFVLAKGIICSMGTVLLLMPALILRMYPSIEKTRHRSFLPQLHKPARFLFHLRYLVVIFALLSAYPSYIAQGMNDFLYGATSLSGGKGTEGYEMEQRINQKFGRSNMVLMMFPNTDSMREKQMTEEIESLDFINSATSLAGTIPEGIPESFLPNSIRSLLHTDEYARILIYMDCNAEDPHALDCVDRLNRVLKKYYPGGNSYLLGDTPATIDIRDTIQADYGRVNSLSNLGVALTVLLTFQSLWATIAVMIPIELGIFINMAIPYVAGVQMAFLGYLVVSSIQLGATVDYSIMFTENYLSSRMQMSKREAAISAIEKSMVSILTSGTVLTVVGYLLGYVSTIPAIADLGELIGRGAMLSMLFVLVLLPFLLNLFDPLIFSPHKQERKARKSQSGKQGGGTALLSHTKEHLDMKTIRKLILISLLALAAIVGVTTAHGAVPEVTVDETAYVTLDYYGSPQFYSVVKSCDLNGNRKFRDFGRYKAVNNMSTVDEPALSEGWVEWQLRRSAPSRFYFEVVPENQDFQMPWKFDISYKLNGVPVKADSLAGVNGLVEIEIHAIPNEQASDYCLNNFLLMTAMVADRNDFYSFDSPGGQFQSFGPYQAAIQMALPRSEETFHFYLGAEEFEIPGVFLVMTPVTLSKMDDISEIRSHKENLESAGNAMNDTVDILFSIIRDMQGGVTYLQEGLDNLDYSRSIVYGDKDKVADDTQQLLSSIKNMKRACRDLSDAMGYSSSLSSASKQLDQVADSMSSVLNSINRVGATLNDLFDCLDRIKEDLQAIRDCSGDPQRQAELMEDLRADLEELKQLVSSLGSSSGISGMVRDMESTLAKMEKKADYAANLPLGASSMRKDNLELLQVQSQIINDYAKAMTADLNSIVRQLIALANKSGVVIEGIEDMAQDMRDLNDVMGEAGQTLDATAHLMANLNLSLTTLDSQMTRLTEPLNNGMALSVAGLNQMMDSLLETIRKTDDLQAHKDTIADIIRDEWHRFDDDWKVLDIDTRATKESFTSVLNAEPKSLQIVVRTHEITMDEEPEPDDFSGEEEAEDDRSGVIARIGAVLNRIFNGKGDSE